MTSIHSLNPARGAPALDLQALVKEFRTPSGIVRAVDGIDLRVERGQVVAFLGPNGAGKTTTIDMVLGLSSPTSGSVKVLGQDPSDVVEAGQIAAVMQNGGLLRDLTVRETVRLTAGLFGVGQDMTPYLERAGIGDIADRLVGKCSGGQQQRLRFAMALVSEPGLLLLDEPTTGMDVTGRRNFWSTVRSDADRGRTVLFATHYLDEAELYADRVVVMTRGRIVADGSAEQLKTDAGTRTLEDAFIQLTAAADSGAAANAGGARR